MFSVRLGLNLYIISMNLDFEVVNNSVLFLKHTDDSIADIIDPVQDETNLKKIGNIRIT